MGFGFLWKTNALPKRRTKRITYNKFYGAGAGNHGTRALVASGNKNCDFANRILKCSVGATRYTLRNKELTIPSIPQEYGLAKEVFVFEFDNDGEIKDSVGVMTGNDRLYIYDELTGTPGLKLLSTNTDFKRALRLFSKSGAEKLLLFYNDKIYNYDPIRAMKSVWLEQKVTDACFFNERLFLGEGKTIKYSAVGDYKNFEDSIDEGGELEILSDYGDIIAFTPMGETVFVFFESGVYQLTAKGAARDFVIEDLVYKGGPIFRKSICVCEDKIAFLARDGIYRFDGKKFERFGERLPVNYLPYTDYCKAGYGFGRYFLSFEDASGNRRTVFADFEDKDNFGEIFALDGVGNWDGKVVCVKDREISYLDANGELPEGEKYLFKCDGTDFSTSGEKFVRRIELCGLGECFLTVKGRNGEKILRYQLAGKQALEVGLKGDIFSLEIQLTKGCAVEELTVDLEQIGGR